MGNCLVFLGPNRSLWVGLANSNKVLRIVKTDGKILEYHVSILVKDLLLNFQGFGVGISQKASHHLPPHYELRIGHIYYLLPSTVSVTSAEERSPKTSTDSTGESKQIKLIITKQQLQELLSKKISVEDVLSSCQRDALDGIDCTLNWRPKLETIPEGNE